MTILKLQEAVFSQAIESIDISISLETIKRKRLIEEIIKTTNNNKEIYHNLISLYELTKDKNSASFLNFLKEIFSSLTSNQKIDILNTVHINFDKNITQLFFKEINLIKISNPDGKINREKKWDSIYNYIYSNNINEVVEIKEGTDFFIFLETIKDYEGAQRPHKDKNLLLDLYSILNPTLIKEIISKISYITTEQYSEKDIYNFNRVFLELISAGNKIDELLETNYFKNSDFGVKQKIVEKALDNNINIASYPYLTTFIYRLRRLVNKSSFQEEILERTKDL